MNLTTLKEALAVSVPQVLNSLVKIVTAYIMDALTLLYYAGVIFLQNTGVLRPKEGPVDNGSGEEEIFSEMLSSVLEKIPAVDRKVRPFSYHMSKFFSKGQPTNRTEVIENMHLSLESLGEELEDAVPGSSAETTVNRIEANDVMTITGHLRWEVDNSNPEVYSITMDLLKDGFVFRADSGSFVITSRVAK